MAPNRALVLVIQAVNAGGKDGTIAEIAAALHPGAQVRTERFSRPHAPPPMSQLHDLAVARGPAPGELVMFHRSYYEELLRAVLERDATMDALATTISRIEDTFARRGSTLVKVMLHIDRDEQLRRLDRRRDDHTLHHLHNPDDHRDQDRWDDLMAAYQTTITRTHTTTHPWHLIPANDRQLRNALVADLLHPHLILPT